MCNCLCNLHTIMPPATTTTQPEVVTGTVPWTCCGLCCGLYCRLRRVLCCGVCCALCCGLRWQLCFRLCCKLCCRLCCGLCCVLCRGLCYVLCCGLCGGLCCGLPVTTSVCVVVVAGGMIVCRLHRQFNVYLIEGFWYSQNKVGW